MGGQAPGTTVLVHEWVTGGGLAGSALPASWAAEGGAMRRAIAQDFAAIPGVRVVMMLDDRLPEEPGPWTVVRNGPGAEAERFPRLAAEAEYTALVAPESGGVLAERAGTLERAGGRSLGSTAAAIALTADKIALGSLLVECGIATPRCRRVVPDEGLPEDFDYPAVLKPVVGAGSVDTFVIEDAKSVPRVARALPEALLQPFVPGVPMSASFLVGRGGPRLVGIGRQRMAIDAGRLVYRGGVIPAPRGNAVATLERAIRAVPGLLGFVGVDFIRDEGTGGVTVLEINPRPTTSYVGLTRLLPTGVLARSWIDTVAEDGEAAAIGLAEVVHSRPAVSFLADGTIVERSGKGEARP